MNIGIICEFNPFHSGHQYLINSVKQPGDRVICAMSGNFVQRGEFAVYDKMTRAAVALQNGADLVLELPTPCAVQSAGGFAQAGVALLEATGICGALAFGAECDDLGELQRISREITEKDAQIKSAMAQGLSYPQARKSVITSPLLDTPNNILALEYLRCTTLQPMAVKRIGKGHDSEDATYSASAIRKQLPDGQIASLHHCESAILYKLRTMQAKDFAQIEDVTEGLENRIYEAVQTSATLEELYDTIKTKRYTHSRIRRIILRAFLGIDKNTPKRPQYIRILGFNENGKALLGEIKQHASLPIITRYADAKGCGGDVLAQFEAESRYTDIYNLGFTVPKPRGSEKTDQIIMIKD